MRIVHQLRCVSVITSVCLSTVILASGWQLWRLSGEYRAFSSAQQTSYRLMQMQTVMLAVSRADPILPDTAAQLQEADQTVAQLQTAILANLPEAQRPAFKATLAQGWGPYLAQFRSAVNIAGESPQDALNIPEAIYRNYLEATIAQLRAQNKVQQQQATQLSEQIDLRLRWLLWLILLPLSAAGLLIIVPQWWVGRKIAQRLAALSSVSQQLAQGNLTARAPEFNNELGDLGRAMNRSVDALAGMIGASRQAAATVRQEAASVNQLSQEVHGRTEAQSRELSEMHSAMQSLGTAISTISELSNRTVAASGEARQATVGALAAGSRSADQAQEMARHFASVEQCTRLLVEAFRAITGVANSIRDIAGQTNLLALNAAIEAARAGEHGRGFAVVADEVRKLSQQTHDATQDINHILQETHQRTSEMQEALGTVAEAIHSLHAEGDGLTLALNQIDVISCEVTRLMDEIAEAIEEQTQASQALTGSMADLEGSASETAQDAEHITHELHELNQVADQLEAGMAGFRLR